MYIFREVHYLRLLEFKVRNELFSRFFRETMLQIGLGLQSLAAGNLTGI
jgi:hypothetical protein